MQPRTSLLKFAKNYPKVRIRVRKHRDPAGHDVGLSASVSLSEKCHKWQGGESWQCGTGNFCFMSMCPGTSGEWFQGNRWPVYAPYTTTRGGIGDCQKMRTTYGSLGCR